MRKNRLDRALVRSPFPIGTPPRAAWLIATTTAEPTTWYAKLGAILLLGFFGVMLLRILGMKVMSLWRGSARRPASLALRWAMPPGSFHAEPHHWALANVMVFSVRNGDAWDRLALDEAKDVARDGLRASWGIDDRQSLMEQLRWLSEEGHRAQLQPLARRFTTMPQDLFDEEYAQAERLPGNEDKRDLVWRMRASREDRDGIRQVDFLAWDLVRFIWLCRHGVHLGYLDEAETRRFLLLISQRLQQSYEGWEDCADQFVRARGFWTGGNPAYDESQAAIRATIRLLRDDPRSPWKLMEWRMPLHATPETGA